FIVRGNPVPVVIVFHEVDTFTHNRVHHDGDRFTVSGHAAGFVEGSDDLVEVVAVHFERIPAEGVEFDVEVAGVEHGFGGPVDLLTVPVYGGDEVIHFFGGCEHDGFPVLSFIQLAIPM